MQLANELMFTVTEDSNLPEEFVKAYAKQIILKPRYFTAFRILYNQVKKNHFKEPGTYRIVFTNHRDYKIYRLTYS